MEIWFLISSLFLPRISLLSAYFIHQIPFNFVPYWGDIVLGVLLPRILILIYIYQNLGYESGWFWLHAAFAILAYLSGVKSTSKNE